MEVDQNDSPETKLHLAILQVLLAARKKNPYKGGASGKELLRRLDLDGVDSLREALMFLTDKELVEATDRNFQITAAGVDYLEGNPPKDPPDPPKPLPPSPPWSPGDPPGSDPPKNDPDDPSRVPRRRKPSGGSGEIALPLPDAHSEQT